MTDSKEKAKNGSKLIEMLSNDKKEDKKKKSKDKSKKKDKKIKTDKEATDKKIEELELELAAEKDRRLRTLAEFENFRRRSRSDLQLLTQNATERLVLQLLPVLDDFDRMNLQNSEKMELEALQKGTDLIRRKLQDKLASFDLEPIISEGEKFDVNLHEAISEIEVDNVEPGTILIEAEKGYKLKDKVIRHAKVIVSKAIENQADNDEGGIDE